MFNPVPNNELEISGMQNFLETLFPYEVEIELASIIPGLKSQEVARVTKDSRLVQGLKRSGVFTKPGPKFDETTLVQHIFLQIGGAVMPFQLKVVFVHKI